MDKLLTIAEFAEQAGVTVQAVYRRLKTDLKPYLVENDGVKVLKTEALNLFKCKQVVKENSREKELENKVEELETLIAQLKQDKLTLTERLAENNQNLLEILRQQTQQQENFQVLLGQVQQLLIQRLPPVETPIEEFNEVDLNLNKPVKKSFISRLFKRS